MTATPIPRSLCLTQFSDLDLSVIAELPPGRQPVTTSRVATPAARARAWEFIRQKLRAGRQAYVICPRIESAAAGDALSEVPGDALGDVLRDAPEVAGDDDSSAEQVHRRLSRGELREFSVGLVHGQLDTAAKAEAMEAFRTGRTQVLVATTVVEVGVDVPNATLMFIQSAESFGLSQLHQLRGRISRGKFQGYCFLSSDAAAPEAVSRLQALEANASGFDIAEADFKLRGPGDVLGTRQHGDLPLKVADLVRDQDLLAAVRNAAFELIESGEFDQPAFAPLKIRVLERFGKLFELVGSG
jgi:ATP-dependent DNA helicase RecG